MQTLVHEVSCAYQALVKGEQRFVYLKHVIIPALHEILHDDVELAGAGHGVSGLAEKLLKLRKGELKRQTERNGRGL